MIIDWNKKPEGVNAYCWDNQAGSWFSTEDPSASRLIGLGMLPKPYGRSDIYSVTESQLNEHRPDEFNLWVRDIESPSLSGWHRFNADTCRLVDADSNFYPGTEYNRVYGTDSIHIHIPPGVFVEGLNSHPATETQVESEPSLQQPNGNTHSLAKHMDKIWEEAQKLPDAADQLAYALRKFAEACAPVEQPRAKSEVVKWEPRYGEWLNSVFTAEPMKVALLQEYSVGIAQDAGHLRPTKEAAEKAGSMIRSYSLFLAYVDEHKGEWEVDWGDDNQPKFTIYFDCIGNKWVTAKADGTAILPNAVYMPRHVAEELVDRLNKGEVEF